MFSYLLTPARRNDETEIELFEAVKESPGPNEDSRPNGRDMVGFNESGLRGGFAWRSGAPARSMNERIRCKHESSLCGEVVGFANRRVITALPDLLRPFGRVYGRNAYVVGNDVDFAFFFGGASEFEPSSRQRRKP